MKAILDVRIWLALVATGVVVWLALADVGKRSPGPLSSASRTEPAADTASSTVRPMCGSSSGSRCSSTPTFGIPRLRASSCTWDSGLPSPAVRMPATGGRSAVVSGRSATPTNADSITERPLMTRSGVVQRVDPLASVTRATVVIAAMPMARPAPWATASTKGDSLSTSAMKMNFGTVGRIGTPLRNLIVSFCERRVGDGRRAEFCAVI